MIITNRHSFTLSRHVFLCFYTSSTFAFYQYYASIFAESACFIMVQFQEIAVSPGSFSEASSSVFVAVTFALLGFCISGTLGFAYEHYLFSAVLFCYIVFRGQQPDHMPAALLGLIQLSELQRGPVYSIVLCNVLQYITEQSTVYRMLSLQFVNMFKFLNLHWPQFMESHVL